MAQAKTKAKAYFKMVLGVMKWRRNTDVRRQRIGNINMKHYFIENSKTITNETKYLLRIFSEHILEFDFRYR